MQSPNVSLKPPKISLTPRNLALDQAERKIKFEPPKIKLSLKSEPKIKHIFMHSLKVSQILKIKAKLNFSAFLSSGKLGFKLKFHYELTF